jgi:hypothetical protein
MEARKEGAGEGGNTSFCPGDHRCLEAPGSNSKPVSPRFDSLEHALMLAVEAEY